MTGGESDGGQIQTDENYVMVSEGEYKRKNYVACAMAFIIGLCLLGDAVRESKAVFMKNLTPNQRVLYLKYKKFSTIELHVHKQLFPNPESNDWMVICALIEMRKDRRDYWTLFAAIVAAIVAFVELVLKF
jgi:hypothetical protein